MHLDANLPRVRILASEFLALGEYSCSLPTGTRPGKRWRRLDGIFDRHFIAAGGQPRWIIGEYFALDDPTKIGIRWFKPIIVMRSPAGKQKAASR